MKRFIVLEKPVGETPLAAIAAWRAENSVYATVPASYAGRLDPMASGKLLVLIGDECKKQAAYTDLDKEYEIEILLDIGSDTGDALGLAEYAGTVTKPSDTELAEVLGREQGAHTRPYPAFSSKTVAGKPLFRYALEGALSSIDIPTHTEHIYLLRSHGSIATTSADLEKRIAGLLDLVPRTSEPSKRLGENFRIDAVRDSWRAAFGQASERDFTILKLRVTCASGTYMRSLASRIGAALDTHALALSIKRTKIGRYVPIWKSGFWARSY